MSSKHSAVQSWDAARYQSQHSYVWQYGEALVELLNPQAGERIVDVGCGSGQLTARIAEKGATVIGIDASSEMIAQARANYPEIDFRVGDAASFEVAPAVEAVFSNAALHWVKDQAAAVARIWRALKHGGRFVAEFGGKGNTRRILEAAGGENPWFFPSVGEYAAMLERQGFEVRFATLFDRPTRIEGEHGLEEWLTMFGAALTKEPHAVAQRLRAEMFRDGAWTIDYRRLRVVAVKE
jgi:trans-aconitate 2-methyltransferase